jgi:hypothetical protein
MASTGATVTIVKTKMRGAQATTKVLEMVDIKRRAF